MLPCTEICISRSSQVTRFATFRILSKLPATSFPAITSHTWPLCGQSSVSIDLPGRSLKTCSNCLRCYGMHGYQYLLSSPPTVSPWKAHVSTSAISKAMISLRSLQSTDHEAANVCEPVREYGVADAVSSGFKVGLVASSKIGPSSLQPTSSPAFQPIATHVRIDVSVWLHVG